MMTPFRPSYAALTSLVCALGASPTTVNAQTMAPFAANGDFCIESNDCGLRPGPDRHWEITIPFADTWTFTSCGSDFDTVMYLFSDASCTGTLIASDDDACGTGSGSTIVEVLEPGTYYLTLEGWESDSCGTYELAVRVPCTVEPTGTDEGEPCGTDTNGGCNSDPPVFGSIACGETVSGTWFKLIDSSRDTDWYVLSLEEDAVVTVEGDGEVDRAVYGFLGIDGEIVANPDCETNPINQITVLGRSTTCAGVTGIATATLTGGNDYWIFASPTFNGPLVSCGDGDRYNITVTCDAMCPSCPDLTGDGVVDFGDLLALFTAWGGIGGCEDFNGDGAVDFGDLLFLFAHWGESC